jgi:hypothetical protein
MLQQLLGHTFEVIRSCQTVEAAAAGIAAKQQAPSLAP